MLPTKLLASTIRRSSYRVAITGVVMMLVVGCKGESTNDVRQVSINTVPELDNGANERINRARLDSTEPLILSFDHETDLFTDSGVLLFRRTQLYYSADQGYSKPGSVFVQNRQGTWHGPLIRLPPLEPGQAFRVSGWIKLDDAEQATTASLIVTRVADGETRTLKLGEVNLNPGSWTKLEGEFISVHQIADDIVAAYIDVESQNARYFLDDISVSYTDGEDDLMVLSAGDVKPVATSFIINGSAEEGLEPWGHQGGFISRSSARAHTGEHSILITNRSQDWHAPTMEVNGLQNNVEYEFSIFVYIEDGQQAADMKLTLKRETGGQASYINLAVKQAVESGAWVEVAGTFSSSNVSRSHALTVYLEASDPELSYYVDTLTVKEMP